VFIDCNSPVLEGFLTFTNRWKFEKGYPGRLNSSSQNCGKKYKFLDIEMIPGFAEYQRKTTRVIPIIILTPASPDRINCPSHSFIHSGSITDIIPMPKQRLGETHESSYMHKIWTTGCSPTPRGGKTHPKRQ